MTILTWAKTALYVSLAVLFGFLSFLSWTVAHQVQTLGPQASAVLTRAGYSLQNLNTTLDLVNQPCGGGHPCGLLANLNKTTTKVGDAIVTTQLQERAVSPHVIAAMDTFNVAAQKLGATATALTETAHKTTQTIADVQPVLAQATSTEKQVQDSITTLTTSLAADSQDIDHVLKNTERVTQDAAKVSDHFEKMIDAPKKHTFWGTVKVGWEIIWQAAMLAK